MKKLFGKSGIYIKPENKGKFTKWAKSKDMSVQEAANTVMANPEEYSSTIVKRANFAKNAAKWKHANGGYVNTDPPVTIKLDPNQAYRVPQLDTEGELTFRNVSYNEKGEPITTDKTLSRFAPYMPIQSYYATEMGNYQNQGLYELGENERYQKIMQDLKTRYPVMNVDTLDKIGTFYTNRNFQGNTYGTGITNENPAFNSFGALDVLYNLEKDKYLEQQAANMRSQVEGNLFGKPLKWATGSITSDNQMEIKDTEPQGKSGMKVTDDCPPGFVKDPYTGICVVPYYTSNPNDRRIKSYADSSALYDNYKKNRDIITKGGKFYDSVETRNPRRVTFTGTSSDVNPNNPLQYRRVDEDFGYNVIGDKPNPDITFMFNRNIQPIAQETFTRRESRFPSEAIFNAEMNRIRNRPGFTYSEKPNVINWMGYGLNKYAAPRQPVIFAKQDVSVPELTKEEINNLYKRIDNPLSNTLYTKPVLPEPPKQKSNEIEITKENMKYSPEDMLLLNNYKGLVLKHTGSNINLDKNLDEKLRRIKLGNEFVPDYIPLEPGYQMQPSMSDYNKMKNEESYRQEYYDKSMQNYLGKDWRQKLKKSKDYSPTVKLKFGGKLYKEGGYLKDEDTYITKEGKSTKRGLWANVYLKKKREGKLDMGEGGGIPDRYKEMGFSRVGQKKDSSRPGKKWMVLAKKDDDYKVVHGGYTGMQDYSQHGSEQRKKNFWNRMGGKDSAKATDPFSPLYWHKRIGTWAEGGKVEDGEEQVDVEIEAEELVLRPQEDGSYEIVTETSEDAPTHEEGGVDITLQEGDLVFPKKYINKVKKALAKGEETGDYSDVDKLSEQMQKSAYKAYKDGKPYSSGGYNEELENQENQEKMEAKNGMKCKGGCKMGSGGKCMKCGGKMHKEGGMAYKFGGKYMQSGGMLMMKNPNIGDTVNPVDPLWQWNLDNQQKFDADEYLKLRNNSRINQGLKPLDWNQMPTDKQEALDWENELNDLKKQLEEDKNFYKDPKNKKSVSPFGQNIKMMKECTDYQCPEPMMRNGGLAYKYGGKFPDLTGDNKVTKADVLKGRGVFKKGGKAMKSCCMKAGGAVCKVCGMKKMSFGGALKK